MEKNITQEVEDQIELDEAERKYLEEREKKINKWIETHKKNNFDFSVLSEFETEVLKEALTFNGKVISISWIQRNFRSSYRKACDTIDILTERGAIATCEDMKEAGLSSMSRIILISFE